ncbi:MAG: DEAD/DEAH box helicase [Sphingomonas sp.]|nr:DEAD/DEAH box helicase [Sphingomonas sp.]RZV51904.1 MAG: DEAD/DEAH box helicase [Sphingomonadaceae bacterium]
MSFFDTLGLAEPIVRALRDRGYDNPTPIQRDAIPPLLEGRDLMGIAQTGTGKTAAFALPSLHRLAAQGFVPRQPASCRMLVLSPTRELAAQIARNIDGYAKHLKLQVQCVFGGVPASKHARRLVPGTDILVATPGRLLDLIDQRALTLRNVEIFVLDEADQMMDLGFIRDLKRIAKLLPQERQSLFFSATMPKAIADLGKQFIDNPVRVEVTPQATTAERIEQYATFINQREKQALLTLRLKEYLGDGSLDRALIFTRTKHGADRVVRFLLGAGIDAAAIHGNKSQGQRTHALNRFRSGETRILVATDIAARGIDVPGVSHVFNYELPNVAEQYVHRIGRTARAGAEGIAMSFVAPDEKNYLRAIERLTGIHATPLPLPEGFNQLAAELPKPVTQAEGKRAGYAKRGGSDRGNDRGPRQDRGPRRKKPAHRIKGTGKRYEKREEVAAEAGNDQPRRHKNHGGPRHQRRDDDRATGTGEQPRRHGKPDGKPFKRKPFKGKKFGGKLGAHGKLGGQRGNRGQGGNRGPNRGPREASRG